MRLEMNDASTGEFTQKYRIEMKIEMDRKGSETEYYIAQGQCPYDPSDGEVSLSRIEAYGQCKECEGAIAGVDWRVGEGCLPANIHTYPARVTATSLPHRGVYSRVGRNTVGKWTRSVLTQTGVINRVVRTGLTRRRRTNLSTPPKYDR